MKNTYTVKEIMDGTGLSRQRIHALIKSRKIPTIKEKKYVLVKWLDLLYAADNPTLLTFLHRTLLNDRTELKAAYKDLQEAEKAIRFAKAIRYALVLAEGAPTIDEKDEQRVNDFISATIFFDSLSSFRNPALEEDNEFC
jgi:hypothetical protein